MALTAGNLGMYMTAHKRQPQLWITILGAALTALSTWLLGRRYGATGVGTGFLIVNAAMAPIMVWLWRHCRRVWHGEGETTDH
jgi:O-antigen/teichoic acid export membrane protein